MCCYPYPYVHLLAIVASILLWQILSPSHPPSRHLTHSLSHSLTHSLILTLILHTLFSHSSCTHLSQSSCTLIRARAGVWPVGRADGRSHSPADKRESWHAKRRTIDRLGLCICFYILYLLRSQTTTMCTSFSFRQACNDNCRDYTILYCTDRVLPHIKPLGVAPYQTQKNKNYTKAEACVHLLSARPPSRPPVRASCGHKAHFPGIRTWT